MRHFDITTGEHAVIGIQDIKRELETFALGSTWPRPVLEEWRRTAMPAEEELPKQYGRPGISFQVSSEDKDCVEITLETDYETARMLIEDANDSQTLLDYRHRSRLLSDAADNSVTLRILPQRELTNPVVIRYSYDGDDTRFDAHTFIINGSQAKAQIVEIHEGNGRNNFIAAGTHVKSGDASHLDHVILQVVPDSTVFAYQAYGAVGRDAAYHCFEGQFGSSLAKSRITADCTGQGADVRMNGVYTSKGSQRKDVKPVQRHSAPRCASRSFYKGVVQGDGASVFQGIIEVAEGAFETDAYLSNKNLILNDGARADSIPNLEILNNNVKCSHGSTTGTLSEEELFYLEARGIPREEGRRMLIEAYFEDAIGVLPEGSARDEVHAALAQFMKNWEST